MQSIEDLEFCSRFDNHSLFTLRPLTGGPEGRSSSERPAHTACGFTMVPYRTMISHVKEMVFNSRIAQHGAVGLKRSMINWRCRSIGIHRRRILEGGNKITS